MAACPPAVRCRSCSYEWHSAAMADGLRLLGRCPRCNGALDFSSPLPSPAAEPAADDPRPPHLVLGLPRY
jgi:hypothetical protein